MKELSIALLIGAVANVVLSLIYKNISGTLGWTVVAVFAIRDIVND